MSREKDYSAIVLKKLPFGEADEIVTFYTREAGKVRGKAAAAKLPSSRLGPALQAFFLINLRLAGSNLYKIIGAQLVKAFRPVQENPRLSALAFVAAEIVLRGTPDEQKNEELFELFTEFLDFLSRESHNHEKAELGLVKFKINALEALGLGLSEPPILAAIKQCDFSDLDPAKFNTAKLDPMLSEFIEHQLEREIRSERFLKDAGSVV